MKTKTDDRGPFVIAATVCHEVKRDADGAPSLLGLMEGMIVETNIDQNTGALPAAIPLRLILFIALHAGSRHGRQRLTVTINTPSGLSLQIAEAEIAWTIEQRRNEQTIRVETVLPDAGEYLFDVRVDGRLLTRVPFRVLTRTNIDQAPPPPSVH